jgi:hypothetical protein
VSGSNDEKEITIKSTVIPMYFQVPKDDLPAIKQEAVGTSPPSPICVALLRLCLRAHIDQVRTS